jgi:hypothetical protein
VTRTEAQHGVACPGGGFGGPIVKDGRSSGLPPRTTDNISTRNGSLVLPTAAERNGDFSAVTNASGTPIKIYDPPAPAVPERHP